MKKILFSLLMLCSMMTAWAEGTGDGTKEHPFSGEWKLEDFASKRNKTGGNYLAYDFKLVEITTLANTISVFDDIFQTWVATDLSTWEVGADFISANPIEAYKEYCSLNEDRQSQTFFATDIVIRTGDVVRIYGHFSGAYTWVDKLKNCILDMEIYSHLDDYIYAPTDKMVYLHQFEFLQESDDNPKYTFLNEDELTLPLDRNTRNGINSIFTYALKPEPQVPVEEQIPAKDRTEYSYKFSSYLTDAYADTLYKNTFTNGVQINLQNVYHLSRAQVSDEGEITPIYRGGEYLVETDNNLGTGHKTKLTLTCDPDCNVEHVGGSSMGEIYEVRVNIASGYPYDVKDYQGKKMHLSVFDADNNAIVDNIEFVINASADSTKMEYVMSYHQKFRLNSPKFTIRLSGDLLKEEKVITLDAQPNYIALEEAIQIADSICNEILTNPKHALFLHNVVKLKDVIENSKEGLKLSAYQQSQINQYCKDLANVITGVQQDMQKSFVEVNDAKGLIDAIANDLGAHIHLTSDIDMSLVTDYLQGDVGNQFHGVINGIKDPTHPEGPMYTITGGSENTMPLFNGLTNAAFANIAFKNFTISNGENLGVISSSASHSIFKNIKMESITIYGGHYGGTIAGDVSNGCVFDHIDVSNSHISGYDDGGVVGHCDSCIFRNCHTNSDVLIYSKYGSGGIAGRAERFSVFVDCENQAVVGTNGKYAGGIAGYAMRKYIVKHYYVDDRHTRATGYVYPSADFFNCRNKGKIISGDQEECEKCFQGKEFTPNANAYTGGICGGAYGFRGDEPGPYHGIGHENVMDQCINYGEIYGKYTGGIAGEGGSMNINNCLNACNSLTRGGIVCVNDNAGRNSEIGKPSKITNCLSLADCPLVGVSKNTNPESSNNYSYISNNSNRTPASYEMCVSEEELKSGVVARWLNNGIENLNDGIEPWRQNLELQGEETEVDSHPVLDSSHRVVTAELLTKNAIRIASADELKSFSDRVNNGEQFIRAYLATDIDMIDYDWTPIGKDEDGMRFCGIFDGMGHTISGLRYTSERNEPVGLFGAVGAKAEIRNVIVGKGSEFVCIYDTHHYYDPCNEGVGGIVGKANIGSNRGSVIIENCGSYADIEVGMHGGGILGNVNTDKGKVFVNNCFNMGTVTATKGNSGLLCGYMQNHGVVSNSWSGGQLKASYPDDIPYDCTNSKNQCECLVGYEEQLDIKNCYVVSPATNVDAWTQSAFSSIQDGVTIHEDYADLANGKLAYSLNGNTNDATKSLIWQQNLGTDAHPVFGNKGVYHSRKDCQEYGTICLPYRVKPDENISYYQFHVYTNENDGVQLVFIPINFDNGELPAGTPVLFRLRNTDEYCFNDFHNYGLTDVIFNPKTTETWGLYGTYTETVFADPEAKSIYYVSDGAVKNAKKTKVAPYRAYFRGPDIDELTKDGLAKVRIVIQDEDGETTAIELVGDELVPAASNEIAPAFNGKTYSLMGTEVGEDYRGIVIKNGKKLIQK